MKRHLAALLLLSSSGLAQQVAFQRILNAVTAPTASAAVQNVGQGSHQVTLFVSTTGAGSCTGTAQLEFSFDGSTWVSFPSSPAIQSFTFLFPSAATQTYSFFGSGTFPQVRFNLTAFTSSGTTCSATAQYSGSSGGSGSIQTVGPAGVTFQPFVNYQTVGAATVSVPNSGQTYHQLSVTLTNIGGQTCAATDKYTLALNGSSGSPVYSNVIVNLAIAGSGMNGFTAQAVGFGLGSFQAITVIAQQSGSPGTHCILNVYYSGSFSGSLPTVSSFLPGTSTTNGISYPVPTTQCALSNPIAVTAGTTSVIVIASGVLNTATIRVCQLVITTPTAAAVATVSSAATGGACASPLTFGTFNMAIGIPVSIGSGFGNVLVLPIARDLCLGATVGNVNGIVSYDYQ
jgi:hypothetical protein